jgi:hypothetical protein
MKTSPEKVGGQTRDISDDPIALDGNNLTSPQRSEQIERERCSLRTVIDFDRATAGPFQRKIEMLRGQLIRFGRSHHANLAFEFFDKQAGAQFVVTHVGGENDRALRCGQFVQEIFSLEFVSKLRSKESDDGGVCQHPGEIVERAKRPQIVHQRRRTRENNGELAVDCFAPRPGQKEKNKRPKGN